MSSLERKLRLRTEFLEWLYDASDGEDGRMQDESDFLMQSDATEPELDALIRHLEGERLVRTFLHLGGLLPAGVELTGIGVVEVQTARRAGSAYDTREAVDTGPLAGLDASSQLAAVSANAAGTALTDARLSVGAAVGAGGPVSGGGPVSDNGHHESAANGSTTPEGGGSDASSTVSPAPGPTRATVGLEDELKVASYVSAFRANLDQLGFDDDTYAQAFADMNTLETQLRAPHPHLGVVRELSLALHASLRAATDDEARRVIRTHPLPW